ncbi:MAG: hypothetical protein RIT45_919 [Pseudomonadota bacterium]
MNARPVHHRRHAASSPRWVTTALALGWVVGASGCIRAPDVVLVDRRTALEAEAAGRFEADERRLDDKATDPRPAPLTRATLEAAGWRPKAEHDAIAAMTRRPEDEQERLDALLLRGCVGEARDGTLRSLPRRCAGAVDPAEVGRLVERENRSRRQVWAWLARQRKDVPYETLRDRWRTSHLERVVCGGMIEQQAGVWGPKTCER